MKQSEKLDLILKKLYDYKYDGRDHSIKEILLEIGINATRDEVYNLTKRLDSEGLVEMTSTKESITAEITSYGIEYCEEDSFSFQGSAIVNNTYQINIENSPGTNIINNSTNVSINTQINDIREILTSMIKILEVDKSITFEKSMEIKDLLEEINNNLNSNKIPKFGIKNLIEVASGISSIASLALSLIKFI